MIDEDRNDEGADHESERAEGGVGSITPQAEVAGDDPAGFEVSGVGSEGDDEVVGDKDDRDGSSDRGVGDWDPSSAGGGGGELY
ncbi:MAG: hypothetical protein LC802_12965 [Acidobacteria bacterium]|nr:hypothetical protein [Acidobacteriota bacterium]